MSKTSGPPSFSVRLSGENISPRAIPTRALAEILDAVQKIIADIRVGDSAAMLRLVGVRKGSAVYRLETTGGEETISAKLISERLREFGRSIKPEQVTGEAYPMLDEDILGPLEILSSQAKRLGIDFIDIKQGGRDVLARIGPTTYENFESGSLIEGDTSVYGVLERLGGTERYHCAVRIPYQSERQLWCRVESEELVTELGKFMFKGMTFHGIGTWYKKSRRIKKLRIRHFDPPTSGTFRAMFDEARRHGGDGWDHVEDVRAELAEIRSE